MEQQIGTIAQTAVIERWAWWRAALKDPAQIGKELPVHPGEYQLGYYRTRRKGGTWEPVGIYPDEDGRVVAFRGNKPVDDIENLFTWCCRYPVEYAAYIQALETGKWPDDDEAVAATIGDNSGDVDETASLADQIEAALAGLSKYAKISDDETAAKALSLRNRLNELSREADKARTEEKKPHLEAGKAVDAKWQPLVKKAKTGADDVRAKIGAWETEKYRRQQEEQRKAEEARRAAEEAAREREGETEVLDAPEPAPAPVADPVSIRPTYGKAASVKMRTVVKEVTDWPALSVYMSNHAEAQDVLRKLAQRAVDAGRDDIPGITTEQKADIR
ncbi:hypothetical protein JET14_13485 [Martelella lutilitoris]|uniref:Uncharacterized protein n=1 Tax=Martelella lutilitoris TaxID=2583532 RepID=A0A7T7HHL2_9HYPH|nr:hypothetical protein [Martelella lutilitoris]QQM29336.1 hypothetical protein JET14_13485 [Martelella lutilitoris]